jgi:hypothetical protein
MPQPQGSTRTHSLPDAVSDGMPGVLPPNMRSKRLKRRLLTMQGSVPVSDIATQDAIPEPHPLTSCWETSQPATAPDQPAARAGTAVRSAC